MGSRILLQLAVLAYVAIALSHEKYLLVEVDDNEDEKPSPKVPKGSLIGSSRFGDGYSPYGIHPFKIYNI